MADEMVLKLTLSKYVAERLRAMCHTRGATASAIVTEWVFKANERGEILSPEERRANEFQKMVGDIIQKNRPPKP